MQPASRAALRLARPAVLGPRRSISAAVASGQSVAVTSEDRLALKLRLEGGWRETFGASDSIIPVYECLVSSGKLKASDAQVDAAAALARLPGSLSDARVRLRRWEEEQARLTAQAQEASNRTVSSREKSAQWRGEGWIKGSPSTPAAPAVVGPMCWLSLGPPPAMHPAGVYVHGSVGSGKSTLMDLFCLFGLRGWRVRRQHFHEFALWLHESLHALGGPQVGGAGPAGTVPRKHVLARLVDQLAEEADALCLDEFAVTNVADAAIFAEVLRLLAARQVMVVCTTNRPPEDLYKDGLHRERYIPTLVQHFRGRFLVAGVNGVDFRSEMLRAERGSLDAAQAHRDEPETEGRGSAGGPQRVFFEGGCPQEALHRALAAEAAKLTGGAIKVSWGRSMPVPAMVGGIAQFHFDDLCRKALAAEDFLHVALRFHTVFVHGIPRLRLEEHNEARRFTNLVDALYEHSVRLLCHSEVPLGEVLRSVETLRESSSDHEHEADRLGLFERTDDDMPNFQIQIKELGGREKWKELQDRRLVEEQKATAARFRRLAAPEAVQGTTGSGWSAAPSASDLSAPDQGVAGVMVAAVGSLQESGFAARRAISRLKEMQTGPYLESARRRREAESL